MGKTYWISWNNQKEHKRPYNYHYLFDVDIGGDKNTTPEETAG